MEENDDHARPGGIEGLRRREEHAAVAVGLVLPMDPSPRRGMAKPAVVVDIEERPALARLLIVRDQTMIGESRVLERGERDIGAVDRRDAGRKILAGPDGRRRGRTGAVGREEGRAKRQAHRLRPPEKTTLHGLILNNPLAAPKDLFKAGLQNREDRSSLKASVQRRDSWPVFRFAALAARPNARPRNESHATEMSRRLHALSAVARAARVVGESIGERQKQRRGDKGQVNAHQPIQLAVAMV